MEDALNKSTLASVIAIYFEDQQILILVRRK